MVLATIILAVIGVGCLIGSKWDKEGFSMVLGILSLTSSAILLGLHFFG